MPVPKENTQNRRVQVPARIVQSILLEIDRVCHFAMSVHTGQGPIAQDKAEIAVVLHGAFRGSIHQMVWHHAKIVVQAIFPDCFVRLRASHVLSQHILVILRLIAVHAQAGRT